MTSHRDEWTFSLVAPSSENSEVQIMVKLSSGTLRQNEHVPLMKDDIQESSGWAETVSLLTPEEQRRGGWSFTGPFWSLSSHNLLRITYRPAWQALPEYTNMSLAQECCRRTACGCPKRSVDIFTRVYTTQHIAKVEELSDLRIRGVGQCRAIRIFLKHRLSPLEPSSVPLALRDALRQQQDLEVHCTHVWDREMEDPDSLPPPPWENNSSNNTYGPILTFAMPLDMTDSGPPLLWKVDVPPNPLMAVEAYTMLEGDLRAMDHPPTHIYINGYQSWSFGGSVVRGYTQPQSAMHEVFSRAFNHGGYPAPRPDIHEDEDWQEIGRNKFKYKSDFFACITSDGSTSSVRDVMNRKFPYRLLDETGGPALLVGWLSQHHQLGVVTFDAGLAQVAMHASAGPSILRHSVRTDWAYAQLVAPHNYDEEPMIHYLHAVAAYNKARPLQNGPLLTGWCSWYHYYENITAASLRENFAKLHALRRTVPTNVAVVDDGYMTAWGDWDSLKPGKFPLNGMKGVANDIRSFGMRPGIWMAPFACDKHSEVAKRHPDWIIRNDAGRPANSSNCGKFFFGLDVTNPHVRDYVHSCVKRAIHEWGYDVLKIDFLYAACLEGNGKYDLAMTRAEAMHLALRTIRAAAGPNVFLIGCGCPIGAGVGYVDGMRVSADTGPTWYATFPLPWWDNGTLPSLRAMIRNSMSRAILGHRWWHNDPDCLLLGETTRLTDTEVASAASIVALTCGMLLLSDDLTKVSESRMNILTKIFPMTGATAVVLDLHNTNDGLPSLLRLWCTDRYYDEVAPFQSPEAALLNDSNATATRSTLLARHASFAPDKPLPRPNERMRNCIHVARGLGTWTLLSISNWLDEDTIVHIPSVSLEAPPVTGWEDDQSFSEASEEKSACTADHHGYHVFAFWASSYTWLPEAPSGNVHPSLSKRLGAHETEIFHLRLVTPDLPQYVGSDIHFSCGQELQSFEATRNRVKLCLWNNHSRKGHVYLFIPRHNLDRLAVNVNGKRSTFDVVANTPGSDTSGGKLCIGRIISIPVVVRGDGSDMNGEVLVTF